MRKGAVEKTAAPPRVKLITDGFLARRRFDRRLGRLVQVKVQRSKSDFRVRFDQLAEFFVVLLPVTTRLHEAKYHLVVLT